MTTQEAITAASIKNAMLDPAMDAIAAGTMESRLLHHPATMQADSIAEHMQVAYEALDAVAGMLVRLAELNGVQLHFERQIAGHSDDLARALRRAELNAPGKTISGRVLAAKIAALLDVTTDPMSLEKVPAARRELHRIFEMVPRGTLFSNAVTHHLRPRRTQQMRDEHARWITRQQGRSS